MKRKNLFTLVEMMLALGILCVFMVGMIRFFTETQDLASVVSKKNDIYSSARLALDMISNDIQCLFYNRDAIKKGYNIIALAPNVSNTDGFDQNLRLATRRSYACAGGQTNVTSVSYDFDPKKLRLLITSYGDGSPKWRLSDDMGSISQNNNNFIGFDKDDAVILVEGVVGFNISCYKLDSNVMKLMTDNDVYNDAPEPPDAVQVTLKILDPDTLTRIYSILESEGIEKKDIDLDEILDNELTSSLLNNNSRTFTRVVSLLVES